MKVTLFSLRLIKVLIEALFDLLTVMVLEWAMKLKSKSSIE